jgi:hypothetical protein
MKSNRLTYPKVFIIESLKFINEQSDHYEGKIISQILNLSGVRCEYYYIRTKKELEEILKEFNKIRYRYLHLSMHGSAKSLTTTLDDLPFGDLSLILQNSLDNKRLFISACSAVNESLADRIFGETNCYSIIGHNKKINISDAAIFWASFYHLMFKKNKNRMMYDDIKPTLKKLAAIHNIPVTYFNASKSSKKGYSRVLI